MSAPAQRRSFWLCLHHVFEGRRQCRCATWILDGFRVLRRLLSRAGALALLDLRRAWLGRVGPPPSRERPQAIAMTFILSRNIKPIQSLDRSGPS